MFINSFIKNIDIQDINEFIFKLFSPSGFMARWSCGRWTDFHGWLYIISNILIWAAYFTIPLLLLYFIQKKKNLPFRNTAWLFILFIVLCGTTHFFDALIFWIPVYRLSAFVLLITAVVSWMTIASLRTNIPIALTMKTSEELQAIIAEKTSELTSAYRKLEESEKNYRTLINNNPDLICRFSYDKKIIFINDKIKSLTGKSPDSYIGKTINDFGYPDDYLQSFNECMDLAITTGNPLVKDFSPIVSQMAGMHFQITFVPLIDDSAETSRFTLFTISRNITIEKNYELEQKNRLMELQVLSNRLVKRTNKLQNFAYIISHNLRSPLSGINGLINLYDRITDEKERHQIMLNMKIVTDRLNQTVEDLSSVVQIEQNFELEIEPLSFTEMTNKVKDGIFLQIQNSEASLILNFECDEIYYSKIYLESILLNLMTNAIKYKSNTRKLQINLSTTKTNNSIVLVCQDNGSGMDLGLVGTKIFGLHNTFHGNEGARGVGLYITKNQIESLGGTIEVQSKLDIGTTFTIKFNIYENEKN